MSFYADHVIWKSIDGTWAYGRYERISNEGRPNAWRDGEYDSEWDDEFDQTTFSIAGGGFMNLDSADFQMRRRMANPGSRNAATTATVAERKGWDEMLKAANDPAYAKELEKKRKRAATAAFRKQVRKSLQDLNLRLGKSYTVTFSADGPATSHLGIFSSASGFLTREGDWLCIEAKETLKTGQRKRVLLKVWNEKTKTQAPKVSRVTENYQSAVWR